VRGLRGHADPLRRRAHRRRRAAARDGEEPRQTLLSDAAIDQRIDLALAAIAAPGKTKRKRVRK
jgi:hypothetical protein